MAIFSRVESEKQRIHGGAVVRVYAVHGRARKPDIYLARWLFRRDEAGVKLGCRLSVSCLCDKTDRQTGGE